jgi:hypothetical protein
MTTMGAMLGTVMSKLEREEVSVRGAFRKAIRNKSLMLSEDITDLALVDINVYMATLSRLVRALAALPNLSALSIASLHRNCGSQSPGR